MTRRRSSLFLLLVWATALGISASRAQTTTGDIKTTGNCSPVVVQPKDGFEIICHDSTLTRAEALKQANQISEILSKLRATSHDSSEAVKKLDKILQQLNDMSATTAETNSKLALSTAPIYTIPVIDGVATPDLSRGLTQRVVLHADTIIAPPRLPDMRKDEIIIWTLFVDQDASGNHQYTTQFLEAKTTWPGLVGNMRVSFEFISESTGGTSMRAVPIGNMLKPEGTGKK